MYTWKKDKHNIYTIDFNGEICVQDLTAAVQEISKSDPENKNIMVVYDFTNTKLNIDEEHLPSLEELALSSTQQADNVCIAIVTEKPKTTAFSLIFSASLPKLYTQVFTTRRAAIEWIKKLSHIA